MTISWQNLKTWWSGENCFLRNPWFWLLTAGTVAAVVLTGGLLSLLLIAVPFYAVAAEKGQLNVSNWRQWFNEKMLKKNYGLVDSQDDTSECSPDDKSAPRSEDPAAVAYHTRLFQESVLMLHWLLAPFLALPILTNEFETDGFEVDDFQAEKDTLYRFFYEPWSVSSEGVPSATLISLESELQAYEESAERKTNKPLFADKFALQQSIAEGKIKTIQRYFHTDKQEKAQRIPERMIVFGIPVIKDTVSKLYNLAYQIINGLLSLSSKELTLDWNTSIEKDPEVSAILENLARMKEQSEKNILKLDEEIEKSKRAQEKSRREQEKSRKEQEKSRANIARLQHEKLCILKEQIGFAIKSNDFADLSYKLKPSSNAFREEELLSLINHTDKALRLTRQEFEALKRQGLLPADCVREDVPDGNRFSFFGGLGLGGQSKTAAPLPDTPLKSGSLKAGDENNGGYGSTLFAREPVPSTTDNSESGKKKDSSPPLSLID